MRALEIATALVLLFELVRFRSGLRKPRRPARRAPAPPPPRRRRGIDAPPLITTADLDLAYEEGIKVGARREREAQRIFDGAP